jgi:signal transduction histidine kinase
VQVRLSQEDSCLRVEVKDNGIGIDPEDQEVIFEKFRQVGDTLTDKPQGTGLGLPICREIINHFGGRLWVESEPGKGATFAFTLPFSPAQRKPAAESSAHA